MWDDTIIEPSHEVYSHKIRAYYDSVEEFFEAFHQKDAKNSPLYVNLCKTLAKFKRYADVMNAGDAISLLDPENNEYYQALESYVCENNHQILIPSRLLDETPVV